MEKAKLAISEGYDAFNRGDFDGATERLHPDVEWQRVADFEADLEGRDAVRGNLAPDVFQEQRVEIHAYEAFGDSLLLDATFHASASGSGIELHQRGYHLWKIKDGMGVQFRFFLDHEEAVDAAREQEGLDA
jgi:ketosteroid isomerase-like protein